MGLAEDRNSAGVLTRYPSGDGGVGLGVANVEM